VGHILKKCRGLVEGCTDEVRLGSEEGVDGVLDGGHPGHLVLGLLRVEGEGLLKGHQHLERVLELCPPR
jgi:hypothetical protein